MNNLLSIYFESHMYGPSHRAFLIVPLCGAFFVDLINTTVIQTIFKIFE